MPDDDATFSNRNSGPRRPAWLLRGSTVLILFVAFGAAGCSETEPGGPGGTGTGGSGGGTASGAGGAASTPGAGGIGGGARSCPATAPAAYSTCDVDGLDCSYDERPCPVAFVCFVATPMANVFGWRPRPPEPGSACHRAGQVCEYEDCSADSGMATYWTATCDSGRTWNVSDASFDLCSM